VFPAFGVTVTVSKIVVEGYVNVAVVLHRTGFAEICLHGDKQFFGLGGIAADFFVVQVLSGEMGAPVALSS
jgi:hypothetical protein